MATIIGLDNINIPNKIATIPMPNPTVTIQDLYNDLKEFESTPQGISADVTCSAAGKDDLGGGEFVGITMTMINEWRLEFEPQGGPSYESRIVGGGNLVAVNAFDNNPIYPSSYTQVQIRQSQAPTILEDDDTTIAALVWEESKALTVQKFLALK